MLPTSRSRSVGCVAKVKALCPERFHGNIHGSRTDLEQIRDQGLSLTEILKLNKGIRFKNEESSSSLALAGL